MMNVDEKALLETLKKLGVPVAYMAFKNAKTLPFVVYRGDGVQNFIADNTVYFSRKKYAVELYYENKDATLEARLEQLLTNAGYVWTKEEDFYIETDRLYMTVYNI